MAHLSSDVSETELIKANGGKPLEWPADPLHRVVYFLWVRENLKPFVDKKRLSAAFLMGSHGNPTTDENCRSAMRFLGRMNGLHVHHGWPTGLAGVIKLIKTPRDDWPAPAEKYGVAA